MPMMPPKALTTPEAEVAGLEIALFEMLERAPGSCSPWPGRWILRYLETMVPFLSTMMEVLKRRGDPGLAVELGITERESDAESRPRGRTAACVSSPGISCSKKPSTSAWSGMYQRGKNVVSASSGKTTRSQPWALASRINAISRATTSVLVSALAIGPSWPAATLTNLATRLSFASPYRIGPSLSRGAPRA